MNSTGQDLDTEAHLRLLGQEERIRGTHLANIHTVLVILSSKAMVLDNEALKQKIRMTYPGATVFFMSTLGIPMGVAPPKKIDLVIDFTGPWSRRKWLLARRLRTRARYCYGRAIGFFREFIYDGVYDESKHSAEIPKDVIDREEYVQRRVLEMVGVPVSHQGTLGPDLGKKIALGLPSMRK